MGTNGLGYTTLVLGAGTSLEYGYPSGEELVEMIINRLKASGNHSEKEAGRALAEYNPYSIDNFLNEFPKFDSVVKAAIAELLYEHEDANRKADKGDLYRRIFHKIPLERYSEFKVITFNYDRSLEFHFSRHLNPRAGLAATAFQILSELEIIHVHGRLSALPGERDVQFLSGDRDGVPYGQALRNSSRSEMSSIDRPVASEHRYYRQQAVWDYGQRHLKIIHQQNGEHKRAKEILENSDRIFFLGFAYHELNMEMLGLKWNENPTKQIAGTCYKMPPIEIQRINASVRSLICRIAPP